MNLREILNRMFHSFFVILSCSLIGTYVFQLIFKTEDKLYTHDIGALIILSVMADLSYFIFYSRNELSKNQMLVRYMIHMVYISSLMLFTAFFMKWISHDNLIQIIVFLALIVLVYIAVFLINNYQARKTANVINKKLNERYEK